MPSEGVKASDLFKPFVDPWYSSLENPEKAQEWLLHELVKRYGRTDYGERYDASSVAGMSEYRLKFPVVDYATLGDYLGRVQKGDTRAFMSEPLVCWVMTRGSTGPAKVLPVTKTHVDEILLCGARAILNHVLRTQDFQLMNGRMLNLNLPSAVHTMSPNDLTTLYGYSSGTYAKLHPSYGGLGLVPKQEDIDELGAGLTRKDWKRRFELVYREASAENVTTAYGVTPVILSFARYLQTEHGLRPKDLWNTRALFCTSVRKIQFKYGPALRKLYGDVPLIEIYSATEGVFGQQLDQLPYITPNYDKYLFEVVTGSGTKMLHELKRGEWGRLLVSTCLLPRYDIGDMIEAAGRNYFRVFGRANWKTMVEHRLYRLLVGQFL